ncbi:MAG: N-acetylmuramoyl-L-alanine amidase, partial [Caldisericia bacterium]
YKIKIEKLGKEGFVASWVVEVRTIEEKPVEDKEVIITPPTNIRTGPGLSYDILTTVTERMVLKVISESKDTDGRVWYKIKIEKLGKEGFVASWVVEVSKTQETVKENAGVVKEYTNLRTGPSISYEVIRAIEPDTKIIILGMALNSSNEIWYFSKIDQDIGWIFSGKVNLIYIEKTVDTKIIDKEITLEVEKFLYDGPSEEMKRSDIVSSKSTIKVVGTSLIFPDIIYYEIVYNGKIYWIKWSGEVPKTESKIQINNISFRDEGGNIVIDIISSNEINDYSETLIYNPIRIVVDLNNTILLSGALSKDINKYSVLKVRCSQYSLDPSVVRVVVDLGQEYKYNIKRISTGISITVLSKGVQVSFPVYLSDTFLSIFPSPFEKNNTLYVPAKSLFESLGYPAAWDEKEKILSFFFRGLKVEITESSVVKKGDKTKEFSLSAVITNDILFVPIEFIPFVIDCSVNFDKNNKIVYIDPYILDINFNKESEFKQIYTLLLSFQTKFTQSIQTDSVILSINGLPYPDKNFKENDFVLSISTTPRNGANLPITKIVIKRETNLPNVQINSSKTPPSINIIYSREISKGLKDKIIILDPGHGAYTNGIYYDVGAVGPSGAFESKIVLDIAIRVKDLLETSGAKVIMTRTKENDKLTPNLDQRVTIANSSGADLFISFHLNASTSNDVSGTETYYFHPLSLKFAELVHKKIINALNTIDRGVRNRGFQVVKDINTMPSVLLEPLYISNPNEEKMILDENIRQKLAKAVFDAISEYFNQ